MTKKKLKVLATNITNTFNYTQVSRVFNMPFL